MGNVDNDKHVRLKHKQPSSPMSGFFPRNAPLKISIYDISFTLSKESYLIPIRHHEINGILQHIPNLVEIDLVAIFKMGLRRVGHILTALATVGN